MLYLFCFKTSIFVEDSFMLQQQVVRQAELNTDFTEISIGWVIGFQMVGFYMFHHLHLVVA